MEKKFYQSMWQTIAEEKRPFTGRVRNSKKNGEKYDEQLFIIPILDEKKDVKYFAHMHPDMLDPAQERIFSNEFFREADTHLQNSEKLPWLINKLGQKKDGSRPHTALPRLEGGVRDLANVLYEFLIQPVEQIFSRRHEDAVLIARAQEEPKQFSRLYEKYYPLVKQYFLKRVNNDTDIAEDLTQEVFSRAFTHLSQFRIVNASYFTYLLRIAHNLLVNYYRKQSNADLFISQEKATGIVEIPKFQMEDSMESFLKHLTAGEREIMLMKYREDMRVQEISAKVGKTENAVKLILSRSRKKLKKSL